MQNRKTVFVTGATGNLGGAVVRHLLSKGYRVKALVRNPDSPRAKSLVQENVEIIKGDLNDPASYRNHLQNMDAVFCNLHFKEGVDKDGGDDALSGAEDSGESDSKKSERDESGGVQMDGTEGEGGEPLGLGAGKAGGEPRKESATKEDFFPDGGDDEGVGEEG